MKIQTICFTLLIGLFSESIATDQNLIIQLNEREERKAWTQIKDRGFTLTCEKKGEDTWKIILKKGDLHKYALNPFSNINKLTLMPLFKELCIDKIEKGGFIELIRLTARREAIFAYGNSKKGEYFLCLVNFKKEDVLTTSNLTTKALTILDLHKELALSVSRPSFFNGKRKKLHIGSDISDIFELYPNCYDNYFSIAFNVCPRKKKLQQQKKEKLQQKLKEIEEKKKKNPTRYTHQQIAQQNFIKNLKLNK